MKKKIVFIALFLLFSVLVACGTSTNNENNTNEDNQATETDGQPDNNSNQKNKDDEENDDRTESGADSITESGTYNGQADPHTIEIETDKGPTAFQLSDDAREDVAGLNPGDKVTYTYHKKGEQLVIESIEKSSTNEAGDRITEIGTYNGQADPHTIEIETESGPLAFQLSMDARDEVENLNPGDKVTYTYTKDGDNRVIEAIHKVD